MVLCLWREVGGVVRRPPLAYLVLLLARSSRVSCCHRIDDPRLKEVLYRAFRARLPEVMDQSQHASSSTSSASSGVGNVDQQAAMFLAGMDEWEKEREWFVGRFTE